MTDQLDQDAIELAHRILDLARDGSTVALADYLGSGIPANLTDPAGNTLLMLAAYHGHPDTVAFLVESGADLNRINDRGQSPLGGAVFKNFLPVVERLVAAGADPDVGTPSAMAIAGFFHRDEAIRLMTGS